ncbi:hypothetical protein ACFP81_06385 [Deinococcus lacus]|uniref:WYL domain-containing protein n=1 Tax=Deinococcus lacus TaxID=392561 RepID=A0ABW1YBR8_9DEIO
MELIATTRPEPVAYAYGAYLHGGHLRCGLLFVRKGNTKKTVTLRDPETKQRYRVRLPREAINAPRHLRFSREELEVL